MAIEVPGTELHEIFDDADHFVALVERELRSVVNDTAHHVERSSEVIVAQGEPAAATPEDANVLPGLWQAAISLRLLPWIARVIRAGVQSQIVAVNTSLGRPVITEFDEQTVTVLLLQGAENRLAGIGSQAWDQARAAIAADVAQGASIPTIARDIRAVTGVVEPRATAIARTEVIGASNKSSIEVMRATGLVALKRWIATFDSRVRLSHIEAHGQQVSLDSAFTVGGARLDHPGDFAGPADEVISCRCAMSYVLEEDLPEQERALAVVSSAAQRGSWRPAWW